MIRLLLGLRLGLLVRLLLGLVLPLGGVSVDRRGPVGGQLRGGRLGGQLPGVVPALRVCALRRDRLGARTVGGVGLRRVIVADLVLLVLSRALGLAAGDRRTRAALAADGPGVDTGVTVVCRRSGLSGPVGLRVRLVVSAHLCSSSGVSPSPDPRVDNTRALYRFR